MQGIKDREFKDSGSIANTEICFEFEPLLYVPAFTQKDFHYTSTGLPTQRTSTEDLTNITMSTQLLSLTTTTSTQEASHNNNHLSLEG